MNIIRHVVVAFFLLLFLCGCTKIADLFEGVKIEKTFYDTGEIECETRSERKSPESFQKCYFKSGALMSETLIGNNGNDKSIKNYWGPPKDQIKELKARHPEIFDKKIDMLSLEAHDFLESNEFCQNGERVKSQKEIANGKISLLKDFYCNGNLEYEEKYSDGIIIESVTYFANGKMKYQDFYKNGLLSIGKVFDKDGNLLISEEY